MEPISRLRTVLDPSAAVRLALGWLLVGALAVLGLPDAASLPATALILLLCTIVVVIVLAAFGVVAQAEHLAHRLGEPSGTLVLTLSIVGIEVVLISAVMLGPGEHDTIARDSVMAVAMIILDLVIGIALLIAARRHTGQRANRNGASSYVSLLLVLLTAALVLPGAIGTGGAYAPGAALLVAGLMLALYGFFLSRQTGPQRADFQERGQGPETAGAAGAASPSIRDVLRTHRFELVARTGVLILTVIPIVLLSHDMAALLDEGLERIGAPAALSGILIALVVFLPETITAFRAAGAGALQRVSNLCHGALVSTVGLTVPVVLVIGVLTGKAVILGESPANLVLLAASLGLTALTFLGTRATALHGAAHLLLFALFLLVTLS